MPSTIEIASVGWISAA